jgi:hypothetical protein
MMITCCSRSPLHDNYVVTSQGLKQFCKERKNVAILTFNDPFNLVCIHNPDGQ